MSDTKHVDNFLGFRPFTFTDFVYRLVPALPIKCTMADKSTKTDDALLNGDLDVPCPTTTNAATMTTVVPIDASSRIGNIVTASTTTKNHVPLHRQDSRSESTKNPSSPPPPNSVSISLGHNDFWDTLK